MWRPLQVHHTELTDQPPFAVGVAVRAAGWRHDHPSVLGGYEVANKVVGELVARIGHCDVEPRTTDNECPQIRQGFRRPVDPGK
jgi:hypothetical protein